MAKSKPKLLSTAAEPADRGLPKFLSRAEVLAITNYSYPSLWNKIKAGTFPPGRSMSIGQRSRVVWLESDIREWMLSRPIRWPKGSSTKARSAA
jgi:predicted DNA-binding transcriptional regulator AlpA